jgi:hypothetical protein
LRVCFALVALREPFAFRTPRAGAAFRGAFLFAVLRATVFRALRTFAADFLALGTAVVVATAAGFTECTAKAPPCGSTPIVIQSPPGTSSGPLVT